MKISIALAQTMADALTTAVDGGAGAGHCKIYDENGAGIPADVSVAITTELLLADITLNDPSFAAAVDGTPGADIVLDVTPIPEDSSANNSATATPTLFARLEDSNGLEHQQFDTVLTSGGEMNINSIDISAGSAVQITSGTLTHPEG